MDTLHLTKSLLLLTEDTLAAANTIVTRFIPDDRRKYAMAIQIGILTCHITALELGTKIGGLPLILLNDQAEDINEVISIIDKIGAQP